MSSSVAKLSEATIVEDPFAPSKPALTGFSDGSNHIHPNSTSIVPIASNTVIGRSCRATFTADQKKISPEASHLLTFIFVPAITV